MSIINPDIEPAPWAIGDGVTIRIHPDGRRTRGTVRSLRHDGTRWTAEVEHVIAPYSRETLPAAELLAWDHRCAVIDQAGRITPWVEPTAE
ncbi:hypothetical protein [Embleya sp. NPDC059237]|uniref:hypothetical protein n=1 Tax=Embleya sp. NPDC059237 TaxID=3346784 RepID=UPI00368837A6